MTREFFTLPQTIEKSKSVRVVIIFVSAYFLIFCAWIYTRSYYDYFSFQTMVFCIFILFSLHLIYNEFFTCHFQSFDSANASSREVLILLWTKMFGMGNIVHDGTETYYFVDGYVDKLFERCLSPANRCRLTNNQSLIEQSEAVIFNSRDLMGIEWPQFRSPEQRWIFLNIESPQNTDKQPFVNLPPHLRYNWTFTYRYITIWNDCFKP